MLSALNIDLCLGGKTILDDVSLNVESSKITAVIGPNGAGKSTLLKIITGELKPDHGSVELDDHSIQHWNAIDMARRRAVLPQSSSLTFPFIVRDVVLLGRMPHCNSQETAEDLRITHKALTLVNMEGFVARNYLTLSGGERQRVHLARVLAQVWNPQEETPQYLLLDEPTSNLDIQHQHSTLQLAHYWAERGAGVLVILHDLNLAMTYADDVLLLDQGKTIAFGEVDKVLVSDILEPVFKVDIKVFIINGLARPQIVIHPQPILHHEPSQTNT